MVWWQLLLFYHPKPRDRHLIALKKRIDIEEGSHLPQENKKAKTALLIHSLSQERKKNSLSPSL